MFTLYGKEYQNGTYKIEYYRFCSVCNKVIRDGLIGGEVCYLDEATARKRFGVQCDYKIDVYKQMHGTPSPYIDQEGFRLIRVGE